MTHSNAPRSFGLGSALLFLALAIVVGCGPNASVPQDPPVVAVPPPAVEPQQEPVLEPDEEPATLPDAEPAFSPEREPDRDTTADRDVDPRTQEPGDLGLGQSPENQLDPEPETVEPETVEPETVEPETVEPETVEPETVEPETVEPETVEPGPLEPKDVDEPAVDEPSSEPTSEPFGWSAPEPEPERDLGPPLVDNVKELKKLDPAKPIWFDAKNRRVVMVGQVCLRDGGLELFACLKDTKEHESIVTVDVEAAKVHVGLLASGAMVGSPVRFNPMYMPASGTEIEITLVWKSEKGKRATARAQDWILDAETDKPMTHPWVFGGSGFWVEEETGKRHYMADSGDFICVSNFTTAMLDLPIESSQANSALMYRALTEAIPPLGTPVTLILTPKAEDPEKKEKETPKESSRDETDQAEADPEAESDDEDAADES